MKDLKPDRLTSDDAFCDVSTNKCYFWNDVCDCWVDMDSGKEVTYTSTIRGMWDDLPIDAMSIEKGTKYVCVDTGDVFTLEEGGWVNDEYYEQLLYEQQYSQIDNMMHDEIRHSIVGFNYADTFKEELEKSIQLARKTAWLERALNVATENFENFEGEYGDYH